MTGQRADASSRPRWALFRGRWPTLALAVLGLVAVFGAFAAVRSKRDAGAPGGAEARAAADRFLDLYLGADGRVVRHDERGDTVSEGQAYGMLLAAAIGDQARFESAWSWTQANLQRPDGLLSYLWRGGRVRDVEAASDADLDTARALILAGGRFGEVRYAAEGRRIADAVLAHETVTAAGRPVLVAGPWARVAPYAVNPSYFSPRAFQSLGDSSGDSRWAALTGSGYEIVAQLTRAPPALAPDWARVEPSGAAAATGPPGDRGRGPRHGFDAARVSIRMAEACDPSGPSLAARSWPFLARGAAAPLPAEYALDGRPLGGEHPVAIVSAAAAAHAAGDRAAARDLLARAEDSERRSSSYYGAAWVALGRIMLTTDLMGECPA